MYTHIKILCVQILPVLLQPRTNTMLIAFPQAGTALLIISFQVIFISLPIPLVLPRLRYTHLHPDIFLTIAEPDPQTSE